MGTSERMGDDHKLSSPIYQVSKGGFTLRLTVWGTLFRFRDPGKWSRKVYSYH